MIRKRYLVPTLALCIFLQACGGLDFTNRLSDVLDGRNPLLDSLETSQVITHDQRLKYGEDMGDWVNDALTTGKEIDACKDNPCRLTAVDKFEKRFWDVLRRGHFGENAPARLQKVRTIMEGVIFAARVYYGLVAPRTAGSGPVPNAKRQLEGKLTELKLALQP